jgi:hypothetical protein
VPPAQSGEPTVASALQSVPFTQVTVARQGSRGRISVRPGNYGRDDFADGCDLASRSNTPQTGGVKTCRALLGKVFKALTPAGQLVIHGAGVMPAFDGVTPQQPGTSELRMLLSSLQGMRGR